MPLAVLLLGPPALLFALITWQVLTDGPLVRADEHISHTMVHPDRVSGLLSDLGGVPVAVPVLAAAIGYAVWRGRCAGTPRWWLPPVAAAVLMALVPALIVPLKEWTARHGTSVMPPGDGYYPSGHTATATVAYGSATLLLLPWLRSRLVRRTLVVACAGLVLGVSFGLVRRGYHWPLDVVGSWCLCAVLLAALWLLPRAPARPRRPLTPPPSTPSAPSPSPPSPPSAPSAPSARS